MADDSSQMTALGEIVLVTPEQLNRPAAQRVGWRRQSIRVIAPLALITFGLGTMLAAQKLSLGTLQDPGPGLWPFIVASLIVLTSGILVVTDTAEDYEPWNSQSLRILASLIGLGIFILLFQSIGFLIPAFVTLTSWLRLLARESWRASLLLALIGSITLYVIFEKLLAVPFPEGILLSSGVPL